MAATLWKCPACQSPIEHDDRRLHLLHVDVIYRCPVCRLELVIDRAGNKLVLAPMPENPS
jgi:hypothetical protein